MVDAGGQERIAKVMGTTMTSYEVIELGLFLTFVLVKCVKNRIEKLDKELEGMDRKLDKLDLCAKRHKKKKGGIVTGNFNTLLRPGLRQNFWEDPNKTIQDAIIAAEQRTGVSQVILGEGESYYPGKVIFVDHPNQIEDMTKYDEEYWRVWKTKHKHEEDPG